MIWETDPKDKKKWLQKALKEGKITQDYYNSKIKKIEQQIIDREMKNIENDFNEIIKNNPTAFIRDRHIVLKLKCPLCGTEGENTYGKLDFKILGKDRNGFSYFECPKCMKHLQYDIMTGKIKTRRGLLGFLFGRFS